jgi:hypothetical protein
MIPQKTVVKQAQVMPAPYTNTIAFLGNIAICSKEKYFTHFK